MQSVIKEQKYRESSLSFMHQHYLQTYLDTNCLQLSHRVTWLAKKGLKLSIMSAPLSSHHIYMLQWMQKIVTWSVSYSTLFLNLALVLKILYYIDYELFYIHFEQLKDN